MPEDVCVDEIKCGKLYVTTKEFSFHGVVRAERESFFVADLAPKAQVGDILFVIKNESSRSRWWGRPMRIHFLWKGKFIFIDKVIGEAVHIAGLE